MTILALDLGGTKLAAAAFSDDGEVLHRVSAPLGARYGADVAWLMAEQCDALREHLARHGEGEPEVAGVAVPGIYRAGAGTVWAPNIRGWDDYPLRDELQRALGANTRVVIDSDRAAYILGETWRGAARDARNAIFLAVGTGIGAGILVDGHVLRGHGDIAGAIGWLALDRPWQPAYESCGCFEHHASGPGIAKVAREHLARRITYDGALRDIPPVELSAEHVFNEYAHGDALARAVLDEAVAFWGMAAANLVSLFNPETIVFGGGVFGPAASFLGRIRDEAERWAQPIAIRQVTFVESALGGDAGLFGAARLALLARDGAPEPAFRPATMSASANA